MTGEIMTGRHIYILWSNFCVPCCTSVTSPYQQLLDDVQRNTLSAITNIHFSDNSWIQATLPVCWGGPGVRSIVDLAPSAFIASSCLVRPLVASLSPAALIGFERTYTVLLALLLPVWRYYEHIMASHIIVTSRPKESITYNGPLYIVDCMTY